MLILRILAATLVLTGCGKSSDDSSTSTGSPTSDCATLVGDALPGSLYSITGTSASDVWTVGADDGTGALVLHYDGAGWSREATGLTGDLWWVWSESADSLWFAGEGGRVVHYTPSTDTASESVITDPNLVLFGIWGSSATDIWAVGADTSVKRGIVLRSDGTTWTEQLDVPAQATADSIFKVWGSGPSDVWMVGANKLVMHTDGAGTWEIIDIPNDAMLSDTTTLFTVSGCGTSEVIAVGGFGNAAIARATDGTWAADSPPPFDLVPGANGVYVDCTHGAVAVGNSGAFLERSDSGWAPICEVPVTYLDYHGTWIDPSGGRWAVGGNLTAQTEGVVAYSGPATVPEISL